MVNPKRSKRRFSKVKIFKEKTKREFTGQNAKCKFNDTKLNKIIQKCSVVKPIIEGQIGEGTYGKVYSAKLDKKKIIVKVIETDLEDFELSDMDKEVEYGYYMGELGIGPKVFDAFYTHGKNSIKQYIFMEMKGRDLGEILKNPKISKENKAKSIAKCIEVLRRHIYNTNLYCRDIKPANFLIEGEKAYMIDFGADFCTIDKLPFPFNKRKKGLFELCTILLIQFFIFIKTYYKLDCISFKPFFETPEFMYLIKNPQKTEKMLTDIMLSEAQYKGKDLSTGYVFFFYATGKNLLNSDTENIKNVSQLSMEIILTMYFKCIKT